MVEVLSVAYAVIAMLSLGVLSRLDEGEGKGLGACLFYAMIWPITLCIFVGYAIADRGLR